MEIVAFAQEVLQTIAEHAASYRLGQVMLRNFDRALWVVEKCARWAVPPPLDQDERPQPELVRPLPWVFFLMMLITLRVTRESISIVNLIMGKPPLRSADVVMYIQSKRRYLRTLKYQGNRISRARSTNTQPRQSWYNSLRSLFEFTMCFSKPSQHYGNNNTMNVSNNDEVLVVKDGKPERETSSPVPSGSVETTMERLIEKMMVDLDADSDEDSSFTLTTITTPKSQTSECTIESDQETAFQDTTTPTKQETPKINDIKLPAEDNVVSSTPEKRELNVQENTSDKPINTEKDEKKSNIEDTKQEIPHKEATQKEEENKSPKENTQKSEDKTSHKESTEKEKKQANEEAVQNQKENSSKVTQEVDGNKSHIETTQKEGDIKSNKTLINKDSKISSTPEKNDDKMNSKETENNLNSVEDGSVNKESQSKQVSPVNSEEKQIYTAEDSALAQQKVPESHSPKEDSVDFLQQERSSSKLPRTPKNEQKMANGRTVKSVPSKKKGAQSERRDANTARSLPGNSTL